MLFVHQAQLGERARDPDDACSGHTLTSCSISQHPSRRSTRLGPTGLSLMSPVDKETQNDFRPHGS